MILKGFVSAVLVQLYRSVGLSSGSHSSPVTLSEPGDAVWVPNNSKHEMLQVISISQWLCMTLCVICSNTSTCFKAKLQAFFLLLSIFSLYHTNPCIYSIILGFLVFFFIKPYSDDWLPLGFG